MAKKKELTEEERLEQALVPESEWPYKLPKGWKWVYFTGVIDIQGGTQPPKSQFIDEPREGYIRLVQIRDFASDKYTVYVPDTPKMRRFNKEDILIARYGASLGRICTGMEGVYNVALAKTIFTEKFLYRRFVYWMLKSSIFQAPLHQISRTAQAGFNKDDLRTFPIPLPPLNTQKQIVKRLESLFSKLDEAKEKVESVLESSENRKSAILHKAFTGELTKKWREENGDILASSENIIDPKDLLDKDQEPYEIPDSWSWSTLGNLIKLSHSGFACAKRNEIPPDNEYAYPHLRPNNIGYFGEMNFSRLVHIPKSFVKKDRDKVIRGDILFNNTNSVELVGRSIVIKKDIDYAFSNHITLIRLKTGNVDTASYISGYINSLWTQGYFEKICKKWVGQAGVGKEVLLNIKIPLPPLEEQNEIVNILDKQFHFEEQINTRNKSLVENINVLKRAILSNAFRSKLGS